MAGALEHHVHEGAAPQAAAPGRIGADVFARLGHQRVAGDAAEGGIGMRLRPRASPRQPAACKARCRRYPRVPRRGDGGAGRPTRLAGSPRSYCAHRRNSAFASSPAKRGDALYGRAWRWPGRPARPAPPNTTISSPVSGSVSSVLSPYRQSNARDANRISIECVGINATGCGEIVIIERSFSGTAWQVLLIKTYGEDIICYIFYMILSITNEYRTAPLRCFGAKSVVQLQQS